MLRKNYINDMEYKNTSIVYNPFRDQFFKIKFMCVDNSLILLSTCIYGTSKLLYFLYNFIVHFEQSSVKPAFELQQYQQDLANVIDGLRCIKMQLLVVGHFAS